MSKLLLSPIVFAVFAFIFGDINARPEGGLGKRKSTPSQIALDPNVLQEMQKFKLEVLKSKILNEINLPEAPVIQTPVSVPRNILKLLDRNFEKDNVTEEGEEFIVYPFNDDLECVERNGTACTRFEFELPLENRTHPSVHVWFRKVTQLEPLLVVVSICTTAEGNDRICNTPEIVTETKTEFGWTIFEIPAGLMLLPPTDNRICNVEAYGQNYETSGDHKPFLVANTNFATSERKRRSTRTVPGKICSKECCKIDFYISFKEIGWHFVVAPAGFHANMCYGKCSNEQLNAFPSHYHSTMNLALANKTVTGERKEHPWTPCCSPTNLKPLSMIYKAANDTNSNSTHTLVHHEIPDMIAESCGCW